MNNVNGMVDEVTKWFERGNACSAIKFGWPVAPDSYKNKFYFVFDAAPRSKKNRQRSATR